MATATTSTPAVLMIAVATAIQGAAGTWFLVLSFWQKHCMIKSQSCLEIFSVKYRRTLFYMCSNNKSAKKEKKKKKKWRPSAKDDSFAWLEHRMTQPDRLHNELWGNR